MCYTTESNYRGGTICTKLVGFTLGDARKAAIADGYSIDGISVTAPPKLQDSKYDDSFRVLRVNVIDEKRLAILICKPL